MHAKYAETAKLGKGLLSAFLLMSATVRCWFGSSEASLLQAVMFYHGFHQGFCLSVAFFFFSQRAGFDLP